MDRVSFSAQRIGSQAAQVLQNGERGQAIGQTSSGVFIAAETGWVVFLSFAAWRGPLTVNLRAESGKSLRIDLHTRCQVQSGAILFPSARLAIRLDQAVSWAPPLRPTQILPPSVRLQRLDWVAGRVRARHRPVSRAGGRFEPDSSLERAGLQETLAAGHDSQVISALEAGLGRGPGLTPAGDDLALGFLLALNRWGDRLCPYLVPQPINRALVEAARRSTTALSASLIECAAGGSADERLISALDGLVSGNLPEERIVEHLLGWGHSSGAAAMQGMELVLR